MKRILISLMLALLVVTGIDARTFVLSTGVSNYNGNANNLKHTTQDTKRFADLMRSQTNDISILTGSNANGNTILTKLHNIGMAAQPGDRIIFFFSGHGAPGGIAVYDGLLPYGELIKVLADSKATEKIFFIDACHAGTVNEAEGSTEWTHAVSKASNMAFVVSSRPEEISKENGLLGAGAFTQSLLKGLRGKADLDNNKQITLLELFKYIHGDVMKHTKDKQHPMLIAPQKMHDSVIYVWK